MDSNQKLKTTIQYILIKAGRATKIKIAKLLFYTDFEFFKENKRSVTGAAYEHLEFGPCPAGLTDFTLKSMVKDGTLQIRSEQCFSTHYYEYENNKSPDSTVLSDKEIAHIEKTIEKYGRMNATQLSQKSHRELPYRATKPYQKIPYELAYYMDAVLSDPESDDEFFATDKDFRRVVEKFEKKLKEGKIKFEKAM